jgi:PAS domain S-box-containing protein
MTSRSMDGVVSPAALLDAFVETSDDAMVSHDADGNVTTWNHTAERLFGYAAEEILGEPYGTLFPDHVRDDVRSVVERVIAGDRVKHFETEILRKDGMPMSISMSLCPVFGGGEVPVAAILIARDITEQRLAQATLAEVEARVRESEAMAHVGSWLWDLRTGAVQWSDEFHRIHGVDPLEFDGTFESHIGAIHPDDQGRVRAGIDESVASGRPFEDEYRVVRPDREIRIVQARAQPTVGSAGSVLGLRGIGQDVTDRRINVTDDAAAE